MKRFVRIASLFMLATSLVACDFMDQLLTVNVFDSELKLTASDVSNMTTSELTEEARSPDFYDALEADPAVLDAVLDNVDATLADGGTPLPEYQEAAIIGAHALIYTSPAGDLIDNLVDNLDMLSAPPTTGTGDPDIGAIIEALAPPSVYSGGVIVRDGFVAMIDALAESADYFDLLGASLAGGDYGTDAANPGQIAQNAVIAALVDAITIEAGYALANPGATVGEYLYDLVTNPYDLATNPTGTLAPDSFSFPDATAGTPLGKILLAAGFDPAQFGL